MLSSNTSAVSGDTKYIEDYFSSYLYTGTGATQSINNGLDLATKGGMVWLKGRTGIQFNNLEDTNRGAGYSVYSNSTIAQEYFSGYGITSFNTNGFTLGLDNYSNANTVPFVSWSFAKTAKFFDVVTYTGTGSSRTVAHSLGSTPGCIIVKRTDTTGDWWTYHRGLTSAGYYVRLNTTGAQATSSTLWNSTDPTSTEFSLGVGSSNTSGGTYVAYIFAHDAGGFGLTGTDNVISCGTYTGAYPSTVTVNLGWEPQFIIVKNATQSSDWGIFDVMRGMPWGDCATLAANSSAAENGVLGNAPAFKATPTGFIVDSGLTAANVSGNTHIYIAIRRGPMKVPTDGTKVFAPIARTGNATDTTITTPNFVTDLVVTQSRQGNANPAFFDRLRGATKGLYPNGTGAEFTSADGLTGFDTMTGYKVGADQSQGTINFSPWTYSNLALRRAPSFFDEVCYTGTGTAGQTFSHNLGVAPELMIVKCRSTTGEWRSYSSALTATKWIVLNTTAAAVTGAAGWNNTEPTASVFSVGNSSSVNGSGTTYVAYLFATCAGVSKVGSYTGTGTTKQVDCGFAAGARFVLIKRTDSTGDWYVWDTARGIVSGNDPYLLLNSTAAEVTTTDYIDTYSAGFELSSTAPAALNASGGTYIFLAIA